MEFVEYSFESLRTDSLKLAQLVKGSGYRPDAIAYLARGGWLIGVEVANFFESPLIELSAHRGGEASKDVFAPLLSKLPASVRRKLRAFEIQHRLKNNDTETQKKTLHVTRRYALPLKAEKLLLVDDSLDTGASVEAAKCELKQIYKNTEVKVAVLNSWASSTSLIDADWQLYRNHMLCLPSSKDNKLYGEFCERYQKDGVS